DARAAGGESAPGIGRGGRRPDRWPRRHRARGDARARRGHRCPGRGGPGRGRRLASPAADAASWPIGRRRSAMIRVVLVDDQAVVRMGFRVLLEEHGDVEVVGEASGGREAVEAVRRLAPDVVRMDLRMAAGDGITATRQIVESREGGTPAVLVVTTFDLDEDVFGALEAGADGFLLKDCEP